VPTFAEAISIKSARIALVLLIALFQCLILYIDLILAFGFAVWDASSKLGAVATVAMFVGDLTFFLLTWFKPSWAWKGIVAITVTMFFILLIISRSHYVGGAWLTAIGFALFRLLLGFLVWVRSAHVQLNSARERLYSTNNLQA
jgi:hypothetical protein